MHGQRNPFSSSRQQPTTPPAPYMFNRDLPPSPITPSNMHRVSPAVPRTPYMGSVALPPHAPAQMSSYGLMTPPSSPEKVRGGGGKVSLTQHLTPEYAYTLSYSLNSPPHPQYAQQPATTTPASYLTICLGTVASFHVLPQNGSFVTIYDVLSQLHTQWMRFATEIEIRGARRGTPGQTRIGDFLSSQGTKFAGLTRAKAPDGSECWVLHLAH